MHKGKYESIFHKIQGSVGKCGDDRKDIQRKNYQQSGDSKGNIKKRFSYRRHIILQKTDICNQNKCTCKKYQPYNKGLTEIFLKSTEEGFYSSVVSAFYTSETAMIKCGEGRSYGDDRDTAQDKQEIGQDNIAKLVKKDMYGVVFVEQIHIDILSCFLSIKILSGILALILFNCKRILSKCRKKYGNIGHLKKKYGKM